MLCYTQEDANAEGTVYHFLNLSTIHIFYKILTQYVIFFGLLHKFCFWLLSVFHSTGEILYRVELPYMEEITLIYLENSDNYDDYSKC